MADDVLLEEPRVRVTTTRAELRGVSYPINGITSVRAAILPAPSGRILFLVGGVMAAFLGLALLLTAAMAAPGADRRELVIAVVPFAGSGVGFLVIAAVGIWIGRQPGAAPSYMVEIVTAAGRKRAFIGDRETVERVKAAIDRAVELRG